MKRRDFITLLGGAPVQVRQIWSIGHQTSRVDVIPVAVNRRQSRAERQGVDANPVGDHERVASDIKGLRAALEGLERGSDIFEAPNFECDDIEAERLGRRLNPAHLQCAHRVTDIGQDGQPAEPGGDLAQEFDLLAGEIGRLV